MATEEHGIPIWARPEPGARRPRFSREQIARTALELADREGFDAVSMRRVAHELDAGTMTLYHYVRTKDDLVALMDDALMAEALLPDGELPDGWRDALGAIARRTRSTLLRHPWALFSLQGAQFGPNAMRHFEQSLAAVSTTGLDTPAKFDLLGLVDDLVFGNVLHTSEARARLAAARADPTAAHALVEFGMAQLETGEFPHTRALLGDRIPTTDPTTAPGPPMDEAALDEQFERALETLLDGAGSRFGLDRRTDAAPPPRRSRRDGRGRGGVARPAPSDPAERRVHRSRG
jgi:AcrR family transcriptional regulator